MTINALSFDILSRIFEYNTPADNYRLSIGCKQNCADVISMRALTKNKRIKEKTNFLEILGLYLDKYNNDSIQYLFDIHKIKILFNTINPNDTSLVAYGTNHFNVDANFITLVTDKSLHIENIIRTVTEFLPERAYCLVESIAHHDYKNAEILFDGIIFYKYNRGGHSSDDETIYLLINNANIQNIDNTIIQEFFSNDLTIILGPLVTTIGHGAFAHWTTIKTVIFSNSITSIGKYAFNDCISIISIVIPNSVTTIGYGAFSHCESLTSVVIGNSVTNIGGLTFSHCESLTSIVIPDSVTTIEDTAFTGSTNVQIIID